MLRFFRCSRAIAPLGCSHRTRSKNRQALSLTSASAALREARRCSSGSSASSLMPASRASSSTASRNDFPSICMTNLIASPLAPQPKQWNMRLSGLTLKLGVFSPWNGHSPLRLRPAFLSWTRRPTTCATSTRSRSSCSLSSLIAASSCSRCSDALLTLGSERRLHRVAHPLSFGPACDLRHERLHHGSHPLRVRGARLGDGLAGELGKLVVAELPGQEGLEEDDLRFLV